MLVSDSSDRTEAYLPKCTLLNAIFRAGSAPSNSLKCEFSRFSGVDRPAGDASAHAEVGPTNHEPGGRAGRRGMCRR